METDVKSLVEFKQGEIITDSQIIARAFEMKHANVLLQIDNMLDDYPDLRVHDVDAKTEEFVEFQEREYRGRKFRAAIMNREFFTLLMGRFETDRARQWQRKFNSAFYEMERRLLQLDENKGSCGWLERRAESKQTRRIETDTIQGFVDYATSQGSENAKHYYKHITNATYKALGLIQHKQPNLRDTLKGLELGFLMSAEWVAQQSLKKHMEAGEHYKAIFILVKQDIDRFADGLMIEKISDRVAKK